MAFLRLNGWTIPVTQASASKKWKRSGERTKRTARGAVVDARRNLRRMWECEACFLDHDEAEGLIRLLSGEGHFFDLLDGAQASTGLQPSGALISDARFKPSVLARGGSLGALSWGGQGATGLVASFPAQVDEWTVMYSRLESGLWVTGALRDDGVGYEGGAVSTTFARFDSGLGLFVEENDGAIELWEDNGDPRAIDDLVILPWRASVSQMQAWTASDAPRFGPLPLLRLDGEVLEGADDVAVWRSTLVVGEVTGVDVIQKSTNVPGIGWVNNAKIVRFMLGEVDETFKQAQSYRDNEGYAPPGSPLYHFDGANIDGLANASLAEGDPVDVWFNIGLLGGAHNAVQATPASQPIYRDRARPPVAAHSPGLDFQALHHLRTPVLPLASRKAPPYLVVCVASPDSVSGTQYVHDDALNTAVRRWRRSAATWTFFVGTSATTYVAVPPVTDRVDASYLLTDPVIGQSTVKINEGAEALTAGQAPSLSGFTLGGSNATPSAFLFDGKIIELLAWATGTMPSILEVQTYLEKRYRGPFGQQG